MARSAGLRRASLPGRRVRESMVGGVMGGFGEVRLRFGVGELSAERLGGAVMKRAAAASAKVSRASETAHLY